MDISVTLQGETLIINVPGASDGTMGHSYLIPLSLAITAPQLYKACQSLLEFIKAHDMGGDWCQDNYPTIKNAKAVLARALP